MKRVLIALCCLLCAGAVASAQDSVPASAGFSASNHSPLIGEPVTLTLVATLPANAQVVAWPEFSRQWPPFELIDIGQLEVDESETNVVYRQTLTAILWLPGEIQTPELLLSYQTDGAAALTALPVNPAFFSIPSVLSSLDDPLVPFLPPISLPFLPPQLVVLVICPLITVAYVLWSRWRQQQADRLLYSDMDDLAFAELDRAILSSLQEISHQALEPEAVYLAVADCLRDYVQRQYGIDSPQLTSLELVALMKKQMPVPLAHRLQELLTQADIVKFALYSPQRSEARRFLEASARWIQAAARDIAQRSQSPQEVA